MALRNLPGSLKKFSRASRVEKTRPPPPKGKSRCNTWSAKAKAQPPKINPLHAPIWVCLYVCTPPITYSPVCARFKLMYVSVVFVSHLVPILTVQLESTTSWALVEWPARRQLTTTTTNTSQLILTLSSENIRWLFMRYCRYLHILLRKSGEQKPLSGGYHSWISMGRMISTENFPSDHASAPYPQQMCKHDWYTPLSWISALQSLSKSRRGMVSLSRCCLKRESLLSPRSRVRKILRPKQGYIYSGQGWGRGVIFLSELKNRRTWKK